MTAPVDTSNVLCERTELPQAWCGHCKQPEEYTRQVRAEQKARERDRSKPPLLGRWFRAAYAGVCSRCGDPFEAGEDIRADYPEGTGYIRRACHATAKPRKGAA